MVRAPYTREEIIALLQRLAKEQIGCCGASCTIILRKGP